MTSNSLVNVSQQRPETENQVIYEIGKLMKAWEQRIRFGDLRLAERFLDFRLNILLHLRLDSGEEGILGFHQVSTGEPIGGEKEVLSQGKKGTVLVNVIKLADSPERVVPAFVWFEPIDSFNGFGKHSLYFSSLFGFIFVDSLRYRKLDSAKLPLCQRHDWGALHSHQNQLSCEVVKRSPQIMDNVSCDSHDIDRQGRNSTEIMLGGEVRIEIGHDHCRAFEGSCYGREIIQVLFGPFDLNPYKNKAV